MDVDTARARLQYGVQQLANREPIRKRRVDYYAGRQDLPYAPDGVNAEYQRLRELSIANWLGMAVDAPLQRLRAEGIRTGKGDDPNGDGAEYRASLDADAWRSVWQANSLDARQRIVYVDLFLHGQAVVSVWPNDANPEQPRVRPESARLTYVHVDPVDPFDHDWAVRTFTIAGSPGTPGAVLPGVPAVPDTHVATVYDDTSWARFEKGGPEGFGDWTLVDDGTHDLGDLPFVVFTWKPDAEGHGQSAIDPLIPAQDAINVIRFDTLLAMQFAAFRQRVFTGFDPVQRDENGDPVFRKHADGTLVVDPVTGNPVPVVNSPGRLGVDRALVFPGADTKVFDLNESNLSNYVTVLGEFLSDFFAIAQVPPQYLLNRMANLSGDALAGAESTLASLIRDLQNVCGEAWEHVFRLANVARGVEAGAVDSELVWGDGEARSFAQVVDAIVKLASVGFPKRAQWELIPGATLQKVDRWLDLAAEEQAGSLTSLLGQAAAQGIVPGAEPVGIATPDVPSDVAASAASLTSDAAATAPPLT